MNENNNANKTELAIKYYRIESNHDKEGTYSVEIETSAHTITYPRVRISFGVSQVIAFPINFVIIDEENNPLFNYSLDIQQEQSEEEN